MSDALQTEARRRIYVELKERPGSHFSQLQRRLDMATGQLQYHLRYLADAGLIDVREDGRYTRYFPSLDIDRRWKPALSMLRQPTPRRIVLDLLEHGTSRLNDIAERTDTPASTLSFHLKKLIAADVVERPSRGVYGLTDPDAMVQILAEYRSGFLDAAVDRIVRLFTGVGAQPGQASQRDATGPQPSDPNDAATTDRDQDGDGPDDGPLQARGFSRTLHWLVSRAAWMRTRDGLGSVHL